MHPLQTQLTGILHGRVALAALGNLQHGDDGLGLHLLKRLHAWAEHPPALPSLQITLLSIGTELERQLHRLTAGRYDEVLFLDAADLGAPPGSSALLTRADLQTRLPQASTHRLSLATVAELLESTPPTRVHLLGVQPGSLRAGCSLTPSVQRTITLLAGWIVQVSPPPTHTGLHAPVPIPPPL